MAELKEQERHADQQQDARYRALSAAVQQQLDEGKPLAGGVRGALARAVDTVAAASEWTRDELTAVADYLRRDLAEAAELLAREGEEWRQSPTWIHWEQGFWRWLLDLTDRTACEWHELAEDLRHGGLYVEGEMVGIGTLHCQRCGHTTSYDHPQPVIACPHCGGSQFSRMPLDP